jgi:predicted small lipoprotein YifL
MSKRHHCHSLAARLLAAGAVLSMLTLLGACGQKGPLTLDARKPAAPPAVPASSPSSRP